jgi:1-acyl-sn-glycerol-3-phosphate acyltransferase
MSGLSHNPPRPHQASFLYFLYFVGTIGVYGGFSLIALAPLRVVGLFAQGSQSLFEKYFRMGVTGLMNFQFWVKHWTPVETAKLDPKRGRMVVANHRSTLDVYIFLASIDGVRIVAKRALLFVPFLNVAMVMLRQVFVPGQDARAYKKALDQVRSILDQGGIVGVFPENTRCQPGFRGLQKFNLQPFEAAVAARAQVLPVVFTNTDEAWPKGSFRLKFGQTIQVHTLDPIEASQFSSGIQLMREVKRLMSADMNSMDAENSLDTKEVPL